MRLTLRAFVRLAVWKSGNVRRPGQFHVGILQLVSPLKRRENLDYCRKMTHHDAMSDMSMSTTQDVRNGLDTSTLVKGRLGSAGLCSFRWTQKFPFEGGLQLASLVRTCSDDSLAFGMAYDQSNVKD